MKDPVVPSKDQVASVTAALALEEPVQPVMIVRSEPARKLRVRSSVRAGVTLN